MCGLLGVYATTFASTEYELFRNLLFLNVMRGEDSTGVVRVEKTGKLRTRKAVMASPAFLKNEASEICRTIANAPAPIALLGHTRHATKGKITLKNAHPFKFPNVVGMHNGTIHTGFKHRGAYETDSEALYRNINDVGIEKALNEVEAYDTAYALQFVDTEKNTLNFVKNAKRPLWFTYVYAGTTLLWSSEKAALEFVIDRKNLSAVGWEGDKENPYFTLEDYDLMSIDIGKPAGTASIRSLNVEKKVQVYQASPTKNTGHGGSQNHNTSTIQDTDGEWITTDRGYKFIPKKRDLTLVVDNPNLKQSLKTGTNLTSTGSGSASTYPEEYEGFKDRFGPEELARLSWLQPVEARKAEDSLPEIGVSEYVTDGDNEVVEQYSFKGYQGVTITESEFKHVLKQGCCNCGEVYNLDDPHDFDAISKIHWGERTFFACDECYHKSDNDWVKMTIDGTWPETGT